MESNTFVPLRHPPFRTDIFPIYLRRMRHKQTHIIFICVSSCGAVRTRNSDICRRDLFSINFFYCLAASGFAMRAISFDLFFPFLFTLNLTLD